MNNGSSELSVLKTNSENKYSLSQKAYFVTTLIFTIVAAVTWVVIPEISITENGDNIWVLLPAISFFIGAFGTICSPITKNWVNVFFGIEK